MLRAFMLKASQVSWSSRSEKDTEIALQHYYPTNHSGHL